MVPKRQVINEFQYSVAALATPALIKKILVHGSTSERDFLLNKFIGGRALDYKESRICSDVGGNYPSRGTDVCPWT